ncbi:hypothetical protein Tco_0607210, partial [Tanacetum coccineum]
MSITRLAVSVNRGTSWAARGRVPVFTSWTCSSASAASANDGVGSSLSKSNGDLLTMEGVPEDPKATIGSSMSIT